MIMPERSYAEYERLPGWRWSHIREMAQSPRHVLHAVREADTDTASRAFLRAIHALILEPHRFDASFSVFDGVRRGKIYDAHVACRPGTTVLNPRELVLAMTTAEAVRSHPVVRDLLGAGEPEVSITWSDAETGLPCKARLDWLDVERGIVLDVKTLGTTDERAVASQVARQSYHGQLAHYVEGLRAHGIDARAHLVVCEGKGAQDVAVFALDDAPPDGALHAGRVLRQRLMARLAECVELDEWPGRHSGVVGLCLPTYALDPEIFLSEGAE